MKKHWYQLRVYYVRKDGKIIAEKDYRVGVYKKGHILNRRIVLAKNPGIGLGEIFIAAVKRSCPFDLCDGVIDYTITSYMGKMRLPEKHDLQVQKAFENLEVSFLKAAEAIKAFGKNARLALKRR